MDARPELFELQLALDEALLESGQDTEEKTDPENARRLNSNDPRPSSALERLHKNELRNRPFTAKQCAPIVSAGTP